MKRWIAALLLLMNGWVMAQETTPEPSPSTADAAACPILVENALELTRVNCDATDSNQACYGYVLVDADTRPTQANFEEPGDLVALTNLQSVQLSPLDTARGLWGLMVMSVQANINADVAQTLDDVQIVLFGDTELTAASSFVQVVANTDALIRARPSTNAARLTLLEAGQSVIANARYTGDDWLRVRLSNAPQDIGWIASSLVDSDEVDLSFLPVVDDENIDVADLSTLFGPLQAFYFRSGDADAPCVEAPDSGMLIQTPEGEASVSIWLDEVVVQLNGTSVIDAQANGQLTVSVVEGSATVEANGDSRVATTGEAIDVDLDENLAAISVPSAPRPLDSNDVRAVPISLLDDPVDIPAPAAATSVPTAGIWQFSIGVPTPLTCPDGTEIPLVTTGVPAEIRTQVDSIVISGVRFDQTSPGVYQASYSDDFLNLTQDTLQVVATDRIVGDRIIDLADRICTIDFPIRFQLIQPN